MSDNLLTIIINNPTNEQMNMIKKVVSIKSEEEDTSHIYLDFNLLKQNSKGAMRKLGISTVKHLRDLLLKGRSMGRTPYEHLMKQYWVGTVSATDILYTYREYIDDI